MEGVGMRALCAAAVVGAAAAVVFAMRRAGAGAAPEPATPPCASVGATPSSRVRPCSLAKSCAEEIMNELELELVMDQSRAAVVHAVVRHLQACLKSKPRVGDLPTDLTRSCTLLLARKGGGKTTLLAELGWCLEKRGVVVAFASYTNVAGAADLPSTWLAKSLNIVAACTSSGSKETTPAGKARARMDRINNELVRQRTVALLVVDEVQDVFRSACNQLDSREVVQELGLFANGRAPRVSCVATGSSTWTRRLMFGAVELPPPPAFPNYTGADLNDTKFQPAWLHPFLEPRTFVKLLTHHVRKRYSCDLASGTSTLARAANEAGHSQQYGVAWYVSRAYLCTAGLPLQVDRFVNTPHRHDVCAGGLCAIEESTLAKKLLRALYASVKAIHCDIDLSARVEGTVGAVPTAGAGAGAGVGAGALTDEAALPAPGERGDPAAALHYLHKMMSRVPMASVQVAGAGIGLWYDLADRGFITMDTGADGDDTNGDYVAFAGPQLFMELSRDAVGCVRTACAEVPAPARHPGGGALLNPAQR